MKEQVATLARNGWQLSPEYAYTAFEVPGIEPFYAKIALITIRLVTVAVNP